MKSQFLKAAARTLVPLALVGAILAACSAQAGGPTSAPVTLRLGYFPNVTHSAAVAGVAKGIFAEKLGTNVTLEPKTFNAGPEAVEALFAGGLDATFIGPNPAINAFIKSSGQAIRIIAGATSGGAFFVVRDGITTAEDLRGKKIATPQLGNTQDVALRAWLSDNGLTADAQGGGDVSIMPQSNSQTLETFVAGGIDGAWVPEPWATRMINDGGGHVLVDERDLWPDGKYVTTHLIVRTEFLNQHPDVVKRLIQGQVAATDYVNNSPAEAQAAVVTAINQITGTTTSPTVLASAWANLTFTVDPIASSLQKSADEAHALGFIDTATLTGIYDLTLLNQVLGDAGRPPIAQP
jgi:NitT/TauT family transport system substrate-binding protein